MCKRSLKNVSVSDYTRSGSRECRKGSFARAAIRARVGDGYLVAGGRDGRQEMRRRVGDDVRMAIEETGPNR